ncbi:hypothetical protein [Vulcanococcus limneticus]|uniref:hypothetical protein n=1 Tax=Vulcanococcus limneticus TaxID=2170428 RepID=UPI00398BD182
MRPLPLPRPAPVLQLQRLAGGLLGAVLGYGLTSRLPEVPASLLGALALAATAQVSRRTVDPLRWWGLLGAATGSVLGTAAVLASRLQASAPTGDFTGRALTLGCFALAGGLAGRRLSRDAQLGGGHPPRDLLRSASALTTGIFAVLVTLTFLHSGLDPARAFSSRLSTSLTILVTAIAVPGWLIHLLDQPPLRSPHPQPDADR